VKISLKWLNEYVDLKEFFEAPEKLDEIITNAGLEVENIENFAERYSNVVVGHIVELGRHPDADKLTLCQVDIGTGENQQIICGASNHKQGDKVVAALPGAVLPGDFKIKVSKIRGVESRGMLCSESELALADESEGIVILPQEAVTGMSFAEASGYDDVVFELSVTPNRADCLSHYGLARELAAILDRPCQRPETDFKASGSFCQEAVAVKLEATTPCPRYAGRSIKGVEVKDSPAWLKQRLESLGLNSINNVVDVTNYVMMELGQPLHAFDANEIQGREIKIALSQEGEVFTTLDGTEISLQGDELTIRDGQRAVALAGVVGGLNSGVTESTTEIFLEAAHFTPESVRKTSRRHGIDTDSGYRFSRGTDPDGVLTAMNRACQLIQQVAGGVVSEDFHDEYPSPVTKQVIELSHSLLEDKLGYAVRPEDFMDWMKRLQCEVKSESSESSYHILPPAFRWDLNMDVDLIEEYARLNGYDKIPEHFPPLVSAPTGHVNDYVVNERIVDLMTGEGYLQAVHYHFLPEVYQNEFLGDVSKLSKFGLSTSEKPVMVSNPLSEDTNAMRVSLAPELFRSAVHNYRHGNDCGRVFETGFVFSQTDGEYRQSQRLALLGWGQMNSLWQKGKSDYGDDRPVVYDLKGALESMLERLNVTSYQWRGVSSEEAPDFLHPGQCAGLFFEGKMIGYVGSLHPSTLADNKMRTSVAVAEISVESLMRGQPRKLKVKAISKFPSVSRDFAFLVPDGTDVDQVVKVIQKAGGASLKSVDVFDIYTGKGVDNGFRSVSFRAIVQQEDGTLSEKDLTAFNNKVIEAVEKKLSVKVR
jgi:phenylalanyl-tRNA synthetase beta chain